MKITLLIIHSLFLALANIFCILIAYGVYYILKPANQILFQAPLAVVFSIAVYFLWNLVLQRTPNSGLRVKQISEYIWIYFLAMLWIPVTFFPLHFFTQGYLAAFSNVTAIWLFQIPTNLLAIILVTFVLKTENSPVN